MKILHTSDIHIKERKDDSWKALELLLEIGAKEKIDFFVISGDLFDKKVSFTKLYPDLRPLLNSVEYEFIVIPGNHDETAFDRGAFLGENVKIIRDLMKPLEYEGLRFFGFPFKNITSGEVRYNLRKIKELAAEDKVNVFLFHGELLDHSFSGSDFGDEEINYMGVRLSFFDNLNLQYVLAGHFHTNFQVYELASGGYFVYPGSPLSLTKKEVGKRSINLFKVGNAPKQYIVDTPYYQRIDLTFYPGDEKEIMLGIEEKIKNYPPKAKILLSLTGYTEEKEEEINKKIKEFEKRFENLEIENRIRGIKQLTEDNLFKAFETKLEKLKHPREQGIKKLFIKCILESEE